MHATNRPTPPGRLASLATPGALFVADEREKRVARGGCALHERRAHPMKKEGCLSDAKRVVGNPRNALFAVLSHRML
jgi:hypothetical protein